MGGRLVIASRSGTASVRCSRLMAEFGTGITQSMGRSGGYAEPVLPSGGGVSKLREQSLPRPEAQELHRSSLGILLVNARAAIIRAMWSCVVSRVPTMRKTLDPLFAGDDYLKTRHPAVGATGDAMMRRQTGRRTSPGSIEAPDTQVPASKNGARAVPVTGSGSCISSGHCSFRRVS